MSRPLDGKVVLELGQIYNGPYCGWLLGMMGARVIKVEPPTGDVLRRRKRDRDPYPFMMLNSNKESVVLDLKSDRGRDAFLRLVEHADVVLENFSAGVMERLTLGSDVLLSVNPRVVLASGKGFGLSGPYRDYPAMDLTIQAYSGILSTTGFSDLPPVKAGPAICDFLGGVHLAVGVLGALLQREREGTGQVVETSMHDAAVIATASALGAHMDGDLASVPERTGNRHPALAMAPYNLYAANDGYVAVICVSEVQWRNLAHLIGRDDMPDDPRFATTVDRAEHVDEVDAAVGGWVADRRKSEVASALAAARVPCGVVLSIPEVANDAHLLARRSFVDVEDPDHGTVRLPVSPVRMHGSDPPVIHRLAPSLGEHTEQVLREFLGPR